MINISINPPDLKHPKYGPVTNKEYLSINEIESVYELIAEGLFDKEVPESNEDEIDTSFPSFELYVFTGTSIQLPAIEFPLEHFPHYNTNYTLVHQQPPFQPPKPVQLHITLLFYSDSQGLNKLVRQFSGVTSLYIFEYNNQKWLDGGLQFFALLSCQKQINTLAGKVLAYT